MDKLTQQEEEVMLYIWSLKECFVKDIVAKFPEPQPPYTTVASIVNNLKRKGYVEAKRYGNTYMYTPLIRQSEYKRTFIGGVVRTLEDFEHQWRKGGHDQSLGFARSWSQGGLTGWDQMGSQEARPG